MPTFRICERLISFDYPTSLAECAERILSLAAEIFRNIELEQLRDYIQSHGWRQDKSPFAR